MGRVARVPPWPEDRVSLSLGHAPAGVAGRPAARRCTACRNTAACVERSGDLWVTAGGSRESKGSGVRPPCPAREVFHATFCCAVGCGLSERRWLPPGIDRRRRAREVRRGGRTGPSGSRPGGTGGFRRRLLRRSAPLGRTIGGRGSRHTPKVLCPPMVNYCAGCPGATARRSTLPPRPPPPLTDAPPLPEPPSPNCRRRQESLAAIAVR